MLNHIFNVYCIRELSEITGITQYRLRKIAKLQPQYNTSIRGTISDIDLNYLLTHSTPRLCKMTTSVEFIASFLHLPVCKLPHYRTNRYQQYMRSLKFRHLKIKAKEENISQLEKLGLHIHIKESDRLRITAYRNVKMLKTAPVTHEQVNKLLTTKDVNRALLTMKDYLNYYFACTPVATYEDLMPWFSKILIFYDPKFENIIHSERTSK